MDRTRRLVVTTAEMGALAATAGVGLPSGFAAEPDAAAIASLAKRGLVAGNPPRPVPALAANLAVLARPTVGVRVEVSGRDGGVRAVYAVAGPLGASLLTLPDDRLELSVFAAQALGPQLIRAVPEPDAFRYNRIGAAFGVETDEPFAGRVPLAGLEHYAYVSRLGGGLVGGLGLTEPQARLVQRLTDATAATLRALVSGSVGGEAYLGQVVWVATGQGWVGLRPVSDGTGQRMVELVPVAREDIGVWLAPAIAELVEVHADEGP